MGGATSKDPGGGGQIDTRAQESLNKIQEIKNAYDLLSESERWKYDSALDEYVKKIKVGVHTNIQVATGLSSVGYHDNNMKSNWGSARKQNKYDWNRKVQNSNQRIHQIVAASQNIGWANIQQSMQIEPLIKVLLKAATVSAANFSEVLDRRQFF